MSRHIKANSPKSEAREKVQLFGGVGLIEILMIMFALLISVILASLLIEGITTMFISIVITFLMWILVYLLIKSTPKTNIKGWEYITLLVPSLFKKKRYTYDNFVNKALKELEVQDDFLESNGSYMFAYHIDGKNLNSMDKFDSEKEIHQFNKVINNIPFKFNIYKINEHLDLGGLIENKKDRKSIIKNTKIKKALEENIESLENLYIKNNRYVIMFSFQDLDQAKENLRTIENVFKIESSFIQSKLSNQDLLDILGEITLSNYSDGKSITFYDASIKIKGEGYKKHFSYLYVSGYKKMYETGWLSRLFNSNSYFVNLTIDMPYDDMIINEINKEIKKNEQVIIGSNNDHEVSEKRKMNKLLRDELSNLKNNSSSIREMGIVIRVEAEDDSSLRKNEDKLISDIKKDGLKLSLLKFNQYEAYKYCSPNHSSTLSRRVDVEVLSTFISTSWPFMNDSLYDNKGILIGDTEGGKLNIIDFKENKNSRINSNMFVLASSGAGKTMTTSTIIDDNIKNGDKVFIIDPENEYRSLANQYDGVVIDFSGEDNKINLLQVIPNLSNESIREHITFIGSFMKNLFVEITNLQLAKLKEYVGLLYKKKKITEEAISKEYEKIKWPTFTELKKLYELESKNEDVSIREQMIVLGTYIDELAIGSYSSLWNCQTNLNFDFELIVFDISKYVENVRVVSSLMNIISKIVWGEMNKIYEENKKSEIKRWTSLVIDEAHLLMNKNNIDSLEWISQVTKRIRKRNGSVVIITQNVSDFIGDGEIKHISSKIINNCTYSLVGQLKANDLAELEQMYESSGGLSEYEKKYIVNSNKFEFVLTIGQEKKIYLKNTRPNILNKKTLGWEE